MIKTFFRNTKCEAQSMVFSVLINRFCFCVKAGSACSLHFYLCIIFYLNHFCVDFRNIATILSVFFYSTMTLTLSRRLGRLCLSAEPMLFSHNALGDR